jgi:cell division protein FtsQ
MTATAAQTTVPETGSTPVRPVRHRPRRWPWVLALVLILGLAGGAYYVVRWTSVLGLKQVVVAGVSGDLADRVRDAVDVPIGTPLITVEPAAVVAQVKAAVPEAETVTAVRKWPDAVLVTVTPRTAVAATQANGSWWLLDHYGVPYLQVGAKPEKLLTVDLATPGPEDRATLGAIAVIRSLPKGVAAQVRAVVARSPYRIVLSLDGDKTVIWGDDSQVEAKAKVLPVLLEQPGTTYDISDPTFATVR